MADLVLNYFHEMKDLMVHYCPTAAQIDLRMADIFYTQTILPFYGFDKVCYLFRLENQEAALMLRSLFITPRYWGCFFVFFLFRFFPIMCIIDEQTK